MGFKIFSCVPVRMHPSKAKFVQSPAGSPPCKLSVSLRIQFSPASSANSVGAMCKIPSSTYELDRLFVYLCWVLFNFRREVSDAYHWNSWFPPPPSVLSCCQFSWSNSLKLSSKINSPGRKGPLGAREPLAVVTDTCPWQLTIENEISRRIWLKGSISQHRMWLEFQIFEIC